MAFGTQRASLGLILVSVMCMVGCSSPQASLPIADSPNPDKAYYSELLALVEDKVQEDPDNLGLRVKLASYHQTLEWPEVANGNIEAILRMAPKDPEVMVLVADYYIHRNDFERSWIYAQQADRLGSVHPSLSLIKSKYHYSRRDYSEAARYLDHYFDTGGKLPEAFLVAAELDLQKKDTTKALSVLERGVTANPGHKSMTRLLVALLGQRDQLTELVEVLEGYGKVTEDYSTYRGELLNAYFQAADYEKASRFAASWPESSENGLFEYGSLMLESSMSDSAFWYADRMIQQDSLSVPGRLLKARYFNRRGRMGDAYNFYTSALALDSTNQIALEERGIVAGKIAYLRKLREQQAAMPVFDLTPKKSDN
ncbi:MULTISPECIES: lipopolysaccharide assembly protein LapB [unclassified Imperialibacter]|uniref:tetratricopeptide repeat protein n=1 Tax=unclassified Imperialibacter TaxID=2629706 RepID=UPI001252DD35|nr:MULTISPECIES: hypothetical protein [unclassified Imperialibacter]CAD5259874.1 exported hypothetical protein [Imperialibacter sp. 75]CAD5297945.1 exported hypothetical protein [Imperialibacter sp. 89]VVT01996.1 exported hypothetical protein [Imperialibacter sp. EC-SDR9]